MKEKDLDIKAYRWMLHNSVSFCLDANEALYELW